jgi:hypothetical protein
MAPAPRPAVPLESVYTDEDGQGVHEECHVLNLHSKQVSIGRKFFADFETCASQEIQRKAKRPDCLCLWTSLLNLIVRKSSVGTDDHSRETGQRLLRLRERSGFPDCGSVPQAADGRRVTP